MLAVLVVAVAVLTALRPGRDYVVAVAAPAPAETAEPRRRRPGAGRLRRRGRQARRRARGASGLAAAPDGDCARPERLRRRRPRRRASRRMNGSRLAHVAVAAVRPRLLHRARSAQGSARVRSDDVGTGRRARSASGCRAHGRRRPARRSCATPPGSSTGCDSVVLRRAAPSRPGHGAPHALAAARTRQPPLRHPRRGQRHRHRPQAMGPPRAARRRGRSRRR